jgi:hypothetical protein
MFHLNPENLDHPVWAHSLPSDDPDKIETPAQRAQFLLFPLFKTNRLLPDRILDTKEETKCRTRDENVCVVTGKSGPEPELFWLIPSTWNDTVAHNDATGRVSLAGTALVPAELLHLKHPVCNTHRLGGTHEAWNMLCVDPELHKYLKDGRGAFKYVDSENLPGGSVKVTLEFYWMPQLRGRFGQVIGTESGWQDLIDELQTVQVKGYPPPASDYNELFTKSGTPLRSGHPIHITMSTQDAKRFKSVVGIHWACVLFTALCGAAGRPELLSGCYFDDPVLQWLQREARSNEDESI